MYEPTDSPLFVVSASLQIIHLPDVKESFGGVVVRMDKKITSHDHLVVLMTHPDEWNKP